MPQLVQPLSIRIQQKLNLKVEPVAFSQLAIESLRSLLKKRMEASTRCGHHISRIILEHDGFCWTQESISGYEGGSIFEGTPDEYPQLDAFLDLIYEILSHKKTRADLVKLIDET